MSKFSQPEVLITLRGKRIRESAKAVLFRVDVVEGRTNPSNPLAKSEWFPFSQVRKSSTNPIGSLEKDYIVVTEWICLQKELPTEVMEGAEGMQESPVAEQMQDSDAHKSYEDWSDDCPF